jgi:hypothetical protein
LQEKNQTKEMGNLLLEAFILDGLKDGKIDFDLGTI